MRTSFYRKLENPLGLAVLDLVSHYAIKDLMIVTRINVPEPHRRKGIGRELLQECCSEADLDQVTLQLEVVAYGGSKMSNTELEAWYQRNGFRREGGLMERSPQ